MSNNEKKRSPLLNYVLLTLTVVTFILIWAMKADPTKRNFDFIPNMVYTAAYDAYDANPNFPDGKTLREPVPGTIQRGHMPMHYGTTPEEALRAGRELKNPFSANDVKAFERGTVVFQTFCQVCHGPGGLGDGTVTKRGYPPPPSLLAERALNMADGQMFHIQTYGQNNMPSYASQVSRDDRWKAILYIRSLQSAVRNAQPVGAQTVATQEVVQ